MATKFLEPGTSATFDTSLFSAVEVFNGGATPASDTSNANGQPRALKCSGSAGGNTAVSRVRRSNAVGVNGRASFGYTFDHFATSFDATTVGDQNRISELQTTGGAAGAFAVCLGIDGKLRVVDTTNNVARGTGTTVLTVNTRYRIAYAWTITSTTINELRVWVAVGDNPSVLDITLTNTTIGAASPADFIIGMNVWDLSSTLANTWYTDIYVDDSNALTDPGKIHVTAKRPNANGAANNFSTQIGSSGSGYGTGHSPQVNERALSQTNGWSMIGAGATVTEEYSIENRATGDVDLTGAALVDFMGWVFAKSLLAETANIIVVNTPTNIALTSTAAVFMQAAGSTTYPAGSTDIGIITSTTVTTVSLYECGIVVAYITETDYQEQVWAWPNPRVYERTPSLHSSIYIPDRSTTTIQAQLTAVWTLPNPRVYNRQPDLPRAWAYFPDASTTTVRPVPPSRWEEPNPKAYPRALATRIHIYIPDPATTIVQVRLSSQWIEPNPRPYQRVVDRPRAWVYFPDASDTTIQILLRSGWIEPNPRTYTRMPDKARAWIYMADRSTTTIQIRLLSESDEPNPRHLYRRSIELGKGIFFPMPLAPDPARHRNSGWILPVGDRLLQPNSRIGLPF